MESTKQIPLTAGGYTMVDAEEYDQLMAIGRWTLHYSPGKKPYVRASNTRKYGVLYMHRLINQTPPGLMTDHINGDTLDNRKSNLRTVTNAQNAKNRGRDPRNTSGFMGVSWYKRGQKWRAHIVANYQQKHLGYFADAIEAAKAYDAAARVLHGSFARLNFPGT